MLRKIKNNKSLAIALLIIFISFVIFYTIAHPMYIYDMDDWYNSYFSRGFFPSIKEWNPTKVLPETLMPAISQLASFIIYPISKDYISSLSIAYAITYSLFIVLYVFTMYKLLKNRFKANNWILISMLFIFVLLHFYPYNTGKTNNIYLLFDGNITCYFNYMIPALFNLSVVMFLMSINKDIQEWFKTQNNFVKSFFILAIYLCINSSMFHSIILVSYIGCLLLNSFVKMIKERTKFKDFISDNLLNIVIIFVWLIAIYLESQGQRASSSVSSYSPYLYETLYTFGVRLFEAKLSFWIAFALLNIISLIISIIKKDLKYINLIITFGLSCIICSIFLVLLCDVVKTSYITRTDVLISVYGWVIISMICSLCKIIDEFDKISIFIPIIILSLMFTTVFDDFTYRDNFQSNYSSAEVKKIDDSIIEQVETAVNNNEDYVEIKFPSDELTGWPQNPDMAGRVTKALYLHGVVNKKIDATFIGVDLSEIIHK